MWQLFFLKERHEMRLSFDFDLYNCAFLSYCVFFVLGKICLPRRD